MAETTKYKLPYPTEEQVADIPSDIKNLAEKVEEELEKVQNGSGTTGENGATFTPHVDSDGNLSWTNDKELENPATVNIKGEQGEPGPAGKDAEAPITTKAISGSTIEITDASSNRVKGIRVYGDSKQDGTPTMDNPVQIQNVTGNIEVVVTDNKDKTQTVTFPLVEGQKLMEGSYLADDGIHHKRKQIVYNGTENWELRTDTPTSDGYYIFKNNDALKDEFITNGDGLSNYFEIVKSLNTSKNNIRFSSTKGYGAMICIDGNIAKTSEELKTWLSEHNTTIECELATEEVEAYTEEQKEAYNKLQQIETYRDITHVNAMSEELEPFIELTYYTEFVGDKGETGKDGTNGKDGKDGVNGTNAIINGVETLTIQADNHIIATQNENVLTLSLDVDLNEILARLTALENNKTSNIVLNGQTIAYTATEDTIYDLYYADENGTALINYDKICSFNATKGVQSTYNDLNTLNVAPAEAKKIIAVKQSTSEKVDEIAINTDLSISSKNLGNKLYSVGLLSDIHIDGNGDGDNSDSGDSVADFQRALEYFNNTENVGFIAVCGDITYYGYEADYTKFNELVTQYSPNTVVKTIRGNHECYENGESNLNDSNTQYQTNIGSLCYEFVYNNDVYLFVGMAQESKSNPLNADEITFLKTKLASYRNQRVFLFMHYYYGETGNINSISTHGQISDTAGTGKQFIDLIKHYKNVIYFNGHTHLDFRLQKYGANANIQKRTDTMCHRVHISSCSKPRTSTDGTSSSATVDFEGSQGYVMDVYENAIILRGRDFREGKFLPIANYCLDTTPITVEEYIESSEGAITPVMELGSISRSNGTTSDATDTIRTADFVEVEASSTYKITNNTADSSNTCILQYDADKNFITAWNEEYSYAFVDSGGTVETTATTKYLKARISTSDVSTVLTIEKQ